MSQSTNLERTKNILVCIVSLINIFQGAHRLFSDAIDKNLWRSSYCVTKLPCIVTTGAPSSSLSSPAATIRYPSFVKLVSTVS